jgi:ADP-ribose pyrophosphatase YjhB (NUDIX family)/ribosomal protein S18 acetylase RimI-like enzyme
LNQTNVLAMTHVTIRPIATGEEGAVIALWGACGLTRPWNDAAQDIAFARGKPNSDVLVGVDAAGTIRAAAMVGHDGHRGTMYYVGVDPDHRRHGFGRQMVAAAEAWMEARGVWKANLLVRATNTAVLGFYERLGYTPGTALQIEKGIGAAGREAAARKAAAAEPSLIAASPWPRCGASAAIFRNNEVLLIQRGKGHLKGLWSLPGGHIEPGERAHDAALREVSEETGVDAAIDGLVDTHEVLLKKPDGSLLAHYLIAVFHGRWLAGAPHPAADAAAARFVPVGELPRYDLTEGAAAMIERARALSVRDAAH